MKTLKKLFLLIAVTVLLFSCSKDDQHDFDMPGFSGKDHKGHPIVKERIFVVKPNGDNDTESLIDAFTNATAFTQASGQASVVQLIAGNYYIDFMEIREFYGKFRGAGKGKSVITTVADLNVDALIGENLNTVLIRFVGGDVCMSDMTIKTPPGVLSTGSEGWIDGLVGFSAGTYQYTSENDYINAVINNVEFAGNWENTDHGLKAEFGVRGNVTISGGWPLSCTDISVTNCSFNGFYLYGALIEQIKEGKIIAGDKNNGNLFDNIFYASLGIWSNVNVKVFVEGNTFFNPAGTRFGIEMYSSPIPASLEQVPQTKVTACNIEQNTFNITGGTGGMLVNDRRRYFYPDESPMLVQVKNNKFNLSNNALTGIGCFNMKGMVIRNNKFAGSGQYGVRIMGPSPYPYNENGLMLGNNLSTATFSVASVLLDTRTRNWKIVGGNLGESIIDNGENNTIISMKMHHHEAPCGQSIVDNLEEMREAAHRMRGH